MGAALRARSGKLCRLFQTPSQGLVTSADDRPVADGPECSPKPARSASAVYLTAPAELVAAIDGFGRNHEWKLPNNGNPEWPERSLSYNGPELAASFGCLACPEGGAGAGRNPAVKR